MPRSAYVIESEKWEGTDIFTKARILGEDNVALLQSNVSAASLEVYDITSNAEQTPVYSSGALTVSAVVFNTLQTSSDWTKDDIGYNFKHQVQSTDFTQEGGHTYRLEYLLTTDDGPLYVIHIRKCLKIST